MKVLVIIPAYNEESALGAVLNSLQGTCPGYDLLVVNDASADRTEMVARHHPGVKVLSLPCNLGIGGSVQTGFQLAVDKGYDIAVQFDADGQHNAADLAKLIAMVAEGEADIAIGSRFNARDMEGFRSTGLRRLGIRIFQMVSLLLAGQKITDHTSGFRAYNRKAFEFLAFHYPVDFPEPEVVIMMARKGFRIRETFSQMFERQGGVSSIPLHKGPYYMTKVLLAMWMAALRKNQS
ncbi:MAG TPA: glycosyltransferase family 2 protein [Bacteroidales bacterium]|nr:glycosyltransferase family 2 protein [Bacteroidales bacterium]HRZ48288.1 glycosyltransferase family 2 protein [Bacteroidales bacterium]